MKPEIYLDMDGVLVDWVGGVLETLPCLHATELRMLRHDDITTYDIARHLGITEERLWREIHDAAWWRGLTPLAHCQSLYQTAARFGPVTLCSSPGRCPGAAAGKLQWIQDHMGQSCPDWIFTPRKERVAAPGRILIDDSDPNCQSWVRAGGCSILFPQYWNRLSACAGASAFSVAVDALAQAVADLEGRA